MKVKAITYGKTINIGNYQSVKVEITVEAEGEEKAMEVYEKAKLFIAKREQEILNPS